MKGQPDKITLTAEDFRRIREVFESALDRPPEDRQAFIEKACDGDAALLNEVERMLSAESGNDLLLDRIAPLAPSPIGNSPHPSQSDRFRTGEVFARRFRIVSVVGRGGMGEVYRAEDLMLGQSVALKFLPESANGNLNRLARFYDEVRLARQITHPNVCRVFDIGEADGQTYLSMEYIDGEDLGSLLRRIGRLPVDKAVEFARKLCAGLASAHRKGVLHRDLKPGNIMVDSLGEVRITDFGLAAVAGQLEGNEVRHGTPAYMAPEQLAGREVTAQSDIYALGLVLYEMFTGKAPFQAGTLAEFLRLRQENRVTNPSTLVPDMGPAVERAILRCLDPEPKKRPPSALALAASLPGGDPLAEALAAGETPSPEMVAAAGNAEGISVRSAVVCLAVILVGLVSAVLLGGKTNVLEKTPFEKAPAVLEEKARDLIRAFGYAGPPADRASGFSVDTDYQQYAEHKEKPADYLDQLAKGQPPLIHFWYRQSPRSLVAADVNADGVVSPTQPSPVGPGMIGLSLDPQGRLIQFDAVPPQVEEKQDSSDPPDWMSLFAAAGLDASRFTPSEPRWVPLGGFDGRAAWTGSYPDAPTLPFRVEAASWRGKPVSFRLIGPWSQPERMQPAQPVIAASPLGAGTLIVVCVLSAVLAWRNFRAGRGDLRGAGRLAMFAFGVEMLEWLCAAHHVSSLGELDIFLLGIIWALFAAAMFLTIYVALEPYVRRYWPQSMISWSRLLNGGFRDPLVGGHLLIAIALGVTVASLYLLPDLLLAQYFVSGAKLTSTLDARRMTSVFLSLPISGIGFAMGFFLMLFLFRVVLRRQWLAAAAIILMYDAGYPAGDHPVFSISFATILAGLAVFMLIRFGVLSFVIAPSVTYTLTNFPLTTDFSTWYSGSTIFALAVVLTLTAYAFHTAVAGRPLSNIGSPDVVQSAGSV
jgi:serine/threonine-protein kinase